MEKITEEKQQTAGKQKTNFFRELLDYLVTLAVCFVIVWGVTSFLVRPIEVVGSSMFPTLHPDSRGFANILGRRTEGLKRFDIAIIYIEDKEEYIVKRVIGLPGETVSCKNDVIFINGEAIEQPFLNTDYAKGHEGVFTSDIEPIQLGSDEYYCMGDNRPSSRDSRYYGPFKEAQIKAKGAFIFFPFDQFGVKSW